MSRYRIGELIGQGGMALVYRAERELAGKRSQPVVIKRIRPEQELHEVARARLDLEAAIGLVLNHPHVVKVYDYVLHEQDLCIVMEYVDGVSLHALAQHTRLPHDVVRTIVWRMAMALAHVHEKGILHRDVSPGNILVSCTGDIKLADFGVARVRGAPATAPSFKGTAAYASLEALQGQELEPGADLYSLAAVTFELLTGEPPHGWGSLEQILHRHDPASGWVVPPLPEAVPDDLRTMIQLLLVPEHSRKLHTADEVLALLEIYDQPEASKDVLVALVERCTKRAKSEPGELHQAAQGLHAAVREHAARASRLRLCGLLSGVLMLFIVAVVWHAYDASTPHVADTAPIAWTGEIIEVAVPHPDDYLAALLRAPAREPEQPVTGPARLPEQQRPARPRKERVAPKKRAAPAPSLEVPLPAPADGSRPVPTRPFGQPQGFQR